MGMASFAPGQAVVCAWQGERHVGRVVGVQAVGAQDSEAQGSGDDVLYEVALESVVVRGVLPEELEPATADVVQALLGWMAMDSEPLQVEGERDRMRRLALRTDYLAFLRQALAGLTTASLEGQADGAPYAVGELVAVPTGTGWALGRVQGYERRGDGLLCVVDTADGRSRVAAGELARPGEGADEGLPHRLGERVRLAVPGHEDDENYVGVVCEVELADAGPLYAVVFDDGDVLAALAADDLAAC